MAITIKTAHRTVTYNETGFIYALHEAIKESGMFDIIEESSNSGQNDFAQPPSDYIAGMYFVIQSKYAWTDGTKWQALIGCGGADIAGYPDPESGGAWDIWVMASPRGGWDAATHKFSSSQTFYKVNGAGYYDTQGEMYVACMSQPVGDLTIDALFVVSDIANRNAWETSMYIGRLLPFDDDPWPFALATGILTTNITAQTLKVADADTLGDGQFSDIDVLYNKGTTRQGNVLEVPIIIGANSKQVGMMLGIYQGDRSLGIGVKNDTGDRMLISGIGFPI